MGQRAKWDLPDTPEPTSDRCFLVKVPDDPKHLAAFRGALYELTKPYAWGDDEAHTALVVGERWLANWLAIVEVECDMLHQTQIQFDPDCGLQWSYDGGETWTTISFEACALAGGQQAILDAIEDGLLQRAGGQPDPDSPPLPGTCQTYHVILRGQDKWKIPSPLNEGDTIEISEVHGGWSDGSLLWFCWDGSAYVLGACTGDVPYEASDPVQDGNHMMVILGYDTASAVYADARTMVTIPAGVSNEEGWLQANDGSLYDNGGQIEFDVQICTGGWVHEFDFSTGQAQGWTCIDYLGACAEVSAGGWTADDVFNGGKYKAVLQLLRQWTGDAHLTHIRVVGTTLAEAEGGVRACDFGGDGLNRTSLGIDSTVGTFDVTLGIDFTVHDVRVYVNTEDASAYYNARVSSITLYGDGAEPTW